MSELDVSLRVRWRYDAGAAKQTVGDLDQVANKAKQLGAIDAGAKLGAGLKSAGGQAQGAARDLRDVADGAARLGQAATYNVEYRLAGSLKGARAPAHALAGDLKNVHAITERLGSGRGLERMERELRDVGRRAEDLERKLREVQDRANRFGGRRGHGGGHEFGNEFLSSAGLGGALRFGMSGAAAGGLAAGAGVAAVGAGLAKAAHEAITFETAMAEVNKAVNDLSPEGLKAMEQTILRISRATGIAKEQLAGGVAQAGFAGVPTKDLAEYAAKAGVAFGMTSEGANEALGKLRNVFELTQAGIKGLGDGINVAADNTAAKEPQIISFLYKVGASGKQLGLTADQMTAIGAATIAAGREADVAGTGFNALFQKFKNPQLVHDKDFAKGLRGIGLSVRQLKAEMALDPYKAFLGILERINQLPQAKKSAITNMLGGMEYGDDLATVAGQITQITQVLAKLQDQSARSGSVEKTFAVFNTTTQASIARAGTAMDAFAAKLGQRFTPAIKEAAEWTAKLFGRMTDVMERRDKVEAITSKLMRGHELSKEDQQAIKADPKLKTDAEASANATGNERKRRAGRGILGTIWDMFGAHLSGDALSYATIPQGGGRRGLHERMRGGEAARASEAPHLRDGGGSLRERGERLRDAIPGGGKRADLAEDARIQFAAYNGEVEHGLDRTQRLVRKASIAIREDLARGFRFEGAGGNEAPRIIRASYGDAATGGLGSGSGGGGGPGRFGSFGRGFRRGGGGPPGHGEAEVVAPVSPLERVGLGDAPVASGEAAFGISGPKALHGRRGLSSKGHRYGVGTIEPGVFTALDPTAKAANPRLAASRRKFFDELDRDPQLRRDVIKTASMENGKSASAMTSVLESMVNRAQMRGYTSLRQSIHDGFYGPVNRGGLEERLSEARRQRGEAAIKAVRSGSNQIEYRTDQGMVTDPGARRYMREPDKSGWKQYQGENYFYMGPKGRQWARQQEAADRAEPSVGGGPFGIAGFNMPQQSARFIDPSRMKLSPRGEAERAGDAGTPGGRGAGPMHVTQNFHGGFDANNVARRAQLEQNRAIRRSQAGALHDIGRVG